MSTSESTIAHQIARTASEYQQQRTGLLPKAVSVVLSQDTIVITLHEALSPAEKTLARSAEGAAKVQEFHRQLFADAAEPLRQRIRQLTGVAVREAAAEIEPATGAVIQVFTSGTMVQVFLLAGHVADGAWSNVTGKTV